MFKKDKKNSWRSLFSKQRRRYLRQAIGLGLLLLLAWQLSAGQQFDQWWAATLDAWEKGSGWTFLLPAIVLMPLNWTLEALKWRQLLGNESPVSWRATWASVLAGISVSLATPNRIGEYGGRAMVAPADQAVNIIWTSILGSFCQWTAFLICGWPSLCYWLYSWYQWPAALAWGLALLIPASLLGIWLLLFRVGLRSWLSRLLRNNRWWRWVQLRISKLSSVSSAVALRALGLAVFRFVVYCFQFLLLLWFFDASLGVLEGMSGIFSIYLIQAGIPLPPGLSVISRSEIAVLFWGGENISPLTIVSATFSVYLINLVIPALLGAWVIVRKKSNDY